MPSKSESDTVGSGAALGVVGTTNANIQGIEGYEPNQSDSDFSDLEMEKLDPEKNPKIIERVENQSGVQSLQTKFESHGYRRDDEKIMRVTEKDGTQRNVVQIQYIGNGTNKAAIQYNDLERGLQSSSLDISTDQYSERQVV